MEDSARTSLTLSSLELHSGLQVICRANISSSNCLCPNGSVVNLSWQIKRLSSYPDNDFLLVTIVINCYLLDAILVFSRRTVSPTMRSCWYIS